MQSKTISLKDSFSFVSVLLLLAMTIPLFYNYSLSSPEERAIKTNDIYFIWIDGKRIEKGINPYSRIHESDMLQNNKYTTYLPGFFLLEVLAVKLGLDNFEDFFKIWKFVVTSLYCFIGFFIYWKVRKVSASDVLALFSAFFWYFGRWSLPALRTWQIDFLAIILLLFSIHFLERRRHLSYLIFGASLAIKQIGILVLPLILIDHFKQQENSSKSFLQTLFSASWLFIVPLLVSLPFLYADFSGFFFSILFSLTRNPGGLKLESIDQALGLVGLPAKIPLLLSLLSLYWLFFKNKLTLAQSVALSFLCFISFNSVVFKQYLPWSSAFLGLALADLANSRSKTNNQNG